MKTACVKASCRAALWVVVAIALASCSATGYSISDLAASINATRDGGPPVIQVGDTIKLSFVTRPEWNQEVRVKQDGTAAFLGVDSVQIAGLTLEELDARLTDLYSRVNTDTPSVKPLTVDIIPDAADSGESGYDVVFVIGEVQRPGPVSLVGKIATLTDAIGAAGGHLKATANLSNTILVRRLASGEMRSWRLDADIYQWGEHPPIYLQPRDVVFVPNTAIDEVNIWIDKYIRQMIPFPYLFPPL